MHIAYNTSTLTHGCVLADDYEFRLTSTRDCCADEGAGAELAALTGAEFKLTGAIVDIICVLSGRGEVELTELTGAESVLTAVAGDVLAIN